MTKQRALVYGLATTVIAAAIITFVGMTVGYGRGQASAESPAAASVQPSSVTAGNATAIAASSDDDAADEYGEHERDDDDQHERFEHDDEGGDRGGIPAGFLGDDD